MINNDISETEQSVDNVLLIVPPGVQAEQGFPIKLQELDTRALLAALASHDTKYPLLTTIEPAVIQPLTKFAAELEVQVRVLDGLEGDYPSYWRMQAAVLPHLAAAEIRAAATTARLERKAKGDVVDMKGLKPEQSGDIKALAQENWDAPAE